VIARDDFVDYVLTYGKTKTSSKSSPKSSYNIFPIDTSDASTASNFIGQDNNNTNQTLPLYSPDTKKTSKWNLLPKRETSSHVCKLPKYYGLLTIDNTLTIGGSANIAFITVTSEPYSFQEALSSPYSKQ